MGAEGFGPAWGAEGLQQKSFSSIACGIAGDASAHARGGGAAGGGGGGLGMPGKGGANMSCAAGGSFVVRAATDNG